LSRKSCAVRSAESPSFVVGTNTTPFVRPWSTMTMIESEPSSVTGRSVMKSMPREPKNLVGTGIFEFVCGFKSSPGVAETPETPRVFEDKGPLELLAAPAVALAVGIIVETGIMVSECSEGSDKEDESGD
jgi:hypothetical protein